MDVSSGQLQEMATNVLDKMLVCAKTQQQEKKPRPQQDQALKCPRCDSTNTKFCYYNNYSLSQPRYFCKSCRRYWTKGGTLRNVPIGGGCRKTKRSSKIRTNQDHQFVGSNCNLPNYDSNDLNLVQKGYLGFDHLSILGNPSNPNHDFVPNPNFASFLDTQNPNFMYFGYGNGIGEVESNGAFVGGEMVNVINPYEEINGTQAVTMTTVKQELCNANSGSDQDRNSNFIGCPRSDDNKVLWGYPWQFNGNELDSTRESWINGGFGGLASHGLLNSTPLM